LNLILASASPRRSAILTQLGIPFCVEPSHVAEDGNGRPPLDWPRLFAEEKAVDVSQSHPREFVLGFDTLVFLDENPLGKPKDKNEAFRMLSALSGRSHQVISGVAVARGGKIFSSGVEKTEVLFRSLDPSEIAEYINSGEPMDKAGAYAIQGKGARFVESIQGCYYNVVGLPVARTLKMLKNLEEIENG